jgi:hypothetical protein
MIRHSALSTQHSALRVFALAMTLWTLHAIDAWPVTCNDVANTCTWTWSWAEPTTTQGGGPLDNLQDTTLSVAVNGGAPTTYVKPASGPTGGGTQSQNTTISTPPCVNTVVLGSATARNPYGTSIASNQPQANRDRTADVSCNIPTISRGPATLGFTAVEGGANPANQTINLANSGTGTLSSTITDNQTWLSVSPGSHTTTTETDALTVSVDTTGLSANTYNGTITITASGASNTPQTVAVTLTVTSSAPPAPNPPSVTYTMNFAAMQWVYKQTTVAWTQSGACDPNCVTEIWYLSDSVAYTKVGEVPFGQLSFVHSYTPAPTDTFLCLKVRGVNSAGTSSYAEQQCNLMPKPPTITLNPASVSFTATQGGSSPSPKTVSINSSGGGPMSWSASESLSWLAVSPSNGTTPSTLTLTPTLGSLTAGTYQGMVTITATGATNTPQTIAVTFVVNAPPPTIALSTVTLNFSGTQGGSNPSAQTVNVTNSATGAAPMGWGASVSAGTSWLILNNSGNTPGTIVASANLAGLVGGTYNATIAVTASGATNSPQTIAVTLTVTAAPISPTINVNPLSLFFTDAQGGANPASQILALTNIGGQTLTWTISDNAGWLAVNPSNGSTTTETDTLTVSVDTTGVLIGTFNATITITASGATNTPQTVPVTLTVTGTPPNATPTISFNPASFSFQTLGPANPGTQALSISEGGGSTSVSWSVSDDAAWLVLSPTSGSVTPATVTLTVDATGLAVGIYSGTITISVSGASNTPQTIPVTLIVPNPFIKLNASGLTFTGVEGGANPTDLVLQLTNPGAGTLSTSIADDMSWLTVSPTSHTTTTDTDLVTFSVNLSGLTVGTYRGTVTITATGASNTPHLLPVILDVTAVAPIPPPVTELPPSVSAAPYIPSVTMPSPKQFWFPH